MKAVLSIAALIGAAHIGLVAGEQLKLGDQCVVYAKDSAGVYRMNVTSCDGAPDFTWDANLKKLTTTLDGNNYCMASDIKCCAPLPCPSTQVFNANTCTCVQQAQCLIACPKGQMLNPNGKCECVPMKQCRIACPSGTELNSTDHAQYLESVLDPVQCKCNPRKQCKIACPPNTALATTGECKCVPVKLCKIACPGGAMPDVNCKCPETEEKSN